MTDTVTAPPPGWYDDPTSAGQQRWWSGLGWTDHTQLVPAAVVHPAPVYVPEPTPAPAPVAAPVVEAAPVPQQATAPGGSVALSTPLPTSMTTEEQLAWHRPTQPDSFAGMPGSAPLRGFGAGDGGALHGGGATAHGSYGSSGYGSGYAAPSYGYMSAPPIENPAAKSGLILSLVSLLLNPLLIVGILGIVNSARGLRRAGEIESMGFPNSRRGMARAGLAVGIVTTLICLAAIPLAIERVLPHYDQAATQSAIAQNIQTQSGSAATVVCPASETITVGYTFECTVSLADGSSGFAQVKFVDTSGRYDVTYSAKSSAPTGT